VQLFAQILLNGILLGGLYGLMALGMGLIWGVLRIVNLAHGAIIMLGGYAVYFLYTLGGVDPFAALPVAMVAMFLFGYALQSCLLNLVVRAPMLNTLLITFGLNAVFVYLAQLAFSADFRTINPSYAGNNFSILGITTPIVQLAAFLIALFLAALLWLFLERSRMGRAIRATAQNLTAAQLYGVDPKSIYSITFGIGVALAGAAGGLYGMVSQVSPYVGVPLTAKSFVIAILGGLDNPIGVILGGLFLGVAETMTALYLGPTYVSVVSFGLLVLILVSRPTSLFERG
jgi:branched-chain amino acid transport system permease protein